MHTHRAGHLCQWELKTGALTQVVADTSHACTYTLACNHVLWWIRPSCCVIVHRCTHQFGGATYQQKQIVFVHATFCITCILRARMTVQRLVLWQSSGRTGWWALPCRSACKPISYGKGAHNPIANMHFNCARIHAKAFCGRNA